MGGVRLHGGAAQVLTEWRQRGAVAVAYQQGTLQFVALLVLMRPATAMGLACVPVVVEQRPVMQDQRVLRADLRQGCAPLRDERLGQCT